MSHSHKIWRWCRLCKCVTSIRSVICTTHIAHALARDHSSRSEVRRIKGGGNGLRCFSVGRARSGHGSCESPLEICARVGASWCSSALGTRGTGELTVDTAVHCCSQCSSAGHRVVCGLVATRTCVRPRRGLAYLILLTDSDKTSTLGILCAGGQRRQGEARARGRQESHSARARDRGLRWVGFASRARACACARANRPGCAAARAQPPPGGWPRR